MPVPKGIAAVAYLRLRDESRRGGIAPQPNPSKELTPDSLAFWIDPYLAHLRARNYSEGTLDIRQRDIKVFLSWCADRDLSQASQITRTILEAYQQWLSRYIKSDGKRLGWSTQQGRIVTLKLWFRWMTRQNILLHNPASEIDLPRMEKRLPQQALTLAQIDALLSVPNILDPLGIRDRTILEIFYSCGIRRTELAHLALSDFNAEHRTLCVRKGKGKKDRMVPVGERAMQWLEKYLAEVRPRLCLDTRVQSIFLTGYGDAFNPDSLGIMVSALMKKAGLAGKGSCHILRHSCATHMLDGGADIRYIQQLLGHADLQTTAIYTEVNIRQLQEVHRRCHPTGRLADEPKKA